MNASQHVGKHSGHIAPPLTQARLTGVALQLQIIATALHSDAYGVLEEIRRARFTHLPAAKDCLHRIHTLLTRMEDLVDALLDIAESGVIETDGGAS